MTDLYKRLLALNIRLELVNNQIKIEAPEGVMTSELIQEIRQNKSELIEFLKTYKRSSAIDILIPKIEEAEHYPISSAQRRLWILNKLDSTATYNMPAYKQLELTDIHNFQKAVHAVVERHESLRTTFLEREGEILQRVAPISNVNTTIEMVDLREEMDAQKTAIDFVREDAFRAFDLSNGTLFRTYLLRLNENEYIFYYNLHHIISDGWSMEVLANEIMLFYRAFQKGSDVQLPQLRIQYKDYASWQQEQLSNGVLESQETYWTQKFSDEIPILELPTKNLRPTVKGNTGKSLELALNNNFSARLKAFSLKEGSSLFITLVSIWNVLLHKYSDQTDIVLGTPVAGRNTSELNNQIGFYVNTLALRNQVHPEEHFKDNLNRVKENTLQAYDNQLYPFDSLIEKLNIKRNTGRSVLFDVMLSLQSSTEAMPVSSTGETVDRGAIPSKFDLDIAVHEYTNGLRLTIDYDTNIFAESFVSQMMLHFESLTNALIDNVEVPICEIEYLLEEEKNHFLNAKSTATSTSFKETVLEMFAVQVMQNPNAIAVKFEGKNVSYQELDGTANAFSHYLREKHNVQHKAPVIYKGQRSDFFIVAMLGIMKAGGVYVPMDAAAPENRMQFVAKDTESVCIIDTDVRKSFLAWRDQQHFDAPEVCVSHQDIAYIIYTSGSTGMPKGVVVTHGQMCAKLQEEGKLFPIAELSTYSMTNPSFDVSILETLFPIAFGGTVVVASDDSVLDVSKSRQIIFDNEVSILQGTPTYFSQFIAHLNAEDAQQLNEILKYVILGGESLTKKLADEIKSKLPDVQLNNHYGPTETVIDALVKEDVQRFDKNILGKPLGDTEVYILDAYQNLVPKHVIGEIFIGGPCVANGYLNRAEQNERHFVQIEALTNSRLYKTGDLGKWTEDGEVIFLGRNDSQVKIRGNRVELGEIRHKILGIDGVKDAEVLLVNGTNGTQEIAAYVVMKDEGAITQGFEALRRDLPKYMIPDHFVLLDEIPLSSNGKLDAKRLVEMTELNDLGNRELIEPSNTNQERLLEIFEHILGKESISTTDNFFEIGGTSISLIQLDQSIKTIFNVSFEIVALFSHTTIQEIDAFIANLQESEQKEEAAVSELNVLKF